MARLTDKQKERVIQEYANGATQKEIANMFGVSDVAISKILAKGQNSAKLEKLKSTIIAEATIDFEDFLKSRSGKTSEIITLSQDLVIKGLKEGTISVKEAVGASKVFAELIMTANERRRDTTQQTAAGDFANALITAAREINANTNGETV